MSSKFWIVGGEYRDTSFAELIDGTSTLAGPFRCYEDALAQWKRIVHSTTSNATARFTIAQETARRG
jgi:hypothetical protein